MLRASVPRTINAFNRGSDPPVIRRRSAILPAAGNLDLQDRLPLQTPLQVPQQPLTWEKPALYAAGVLQYNP